MLSDKELIQYSRQVIMPEIDESGQARIKAASIAVIGLGGLGSSCAMYLAAAGVGRLILIDDDQVETSNLQRQVIHNLDSVGQTKVESASKRLKAINPLCEIYAHDVRLTKTNATSLLSDVEIIVDASDNYATRYLLNRCSLNLNKPLVHASAIQFKGQITTFNTTNESPCYECLFEDRNHNEETCENQGVFPPIVGVIGSMQASEALKIVLKLPTLNGTYYTLDLLNNKSSQFRLKKNPNCPSCS